MTSPQISLLVPFRVSAQHPHRARIWEWLQRYWRYELPDAEIVIGHSKSRAFSKTEAVNDAARRARGRIFVILDSDTYIRGSVILHCARQIEQAQRRGHKRWFIPYRRLYRLTEPSTDLVLDSDPMWPFRFSSPPPLDSVESTIGSMHGHHFGAMIQILPREAFETVGCMDPRFKGWGGEDVAFMRAVDTLYAKHKTVNVDVLHLWHPSIGTSVLDRMWEGQSTPGLNSKLAHAYSRATGDRAKMRVLVNAGCEPACKCSYLCRFWSWLRRWFWGAER